MKKIVLLIMILLTALFLMACSDEANESGSSQTDKEESTLESMADSEAAETDEKTPGEISSKETENKSTNDLSESEEGETLSNYSTKEIEYARVWLELGENQDISELNVVPITAGEPLNPDDETSASYPEDVIQLAGSRLIDGSVTYSGNGDGTINIYNVPQRWDGNYPAGEAFYKDIVENTKKVSIPRGDNKEIIKLIEMLHMHR